MIILPIIGSHNLRAFWLNANWSNGHYHNRIKRNFLSFVFQNYVMGINHFCVVSDSVLLLGNLAHLS